MLQLLGARWLVGSSGVDAEKNRAEFLEQGAGQGLGGDVSQVLSSRVLYEEDAANFLGVSYDGVAGGDPF
jgi:hypothetical protein